MPRVCRGTDHVCVRMGQQGFWGPTERLGAHRCNQAPVARTVGENQLCQLCILLRGIDGHCRAAEVDQVTLWCRNRCQSASSL